MRAFNQDKEVLAWIEDNTDLLNELIADLADQKKQMMLNEPDEFHDDIIRDYKLGVEFVVSREVQNNIEVDPEVVAIVLEENDILDLLEEQDE